MNLMENPNFKFQSDWFSKRIPDWEKFLEHQKGAPNLEYLEVGSFEGRSTVWILANILTHPTSRITCIDTFGGSMEHGRMGLDTTVIEDTFWHNIWVIKVENKVRVLKGKSQEVLRRLPFDTYDFAYIDGSHVASDVLTDAVLTFPLIKRIS